jgi:hypothetical protein
VNAARVGLPDDEPRRLQLFQDVGNRARALEAAVVLNLANSGRPLMLVLVLLDKGQNHLAAVARTHDTFV